MSEPTDPRDSKGQPEATEKKTYTEPRVTELGSLEEQTRSGVDSTAATDVGSS